MKYYRVGTVVVIKQPEQWCGNLGEVMYTRRPHRYRYGVLFDNGEGAVIRHFAPEELLVVERSAP